MEKLEPYYEFLEEYTSFLEEMARSHEEKLAAILSHDLNRLEHFISAQQAMTMRLDGLEGRRVRIQEELGCANRTLSQIIDGAPVPRKKRLQDIRKRMEAAVRDIKFYNGKALEAAKTNLKLIDDLAVGNEDARYDAARKRSNHTAETAIFETKI